MQEASSSIELYRERSATDVINVTFEFLRDQFLPLAKGLLFFAGPFLIGANMVAPFASGFRAAPAGGVRPGLFFLQAGLAIAGSLMACAVVIGGLHLYHEDGDTGLTTSALSEMLQRHVAGLIGRQIQLGFVVGIGAALIGGVFAIIGAGLGIFEGDSVGLVVLVVASGGAAVLGWLLYAAPTFSLLLPGQVDGDRPISMAGCVDLIKGRWGQTLGVWILAAVITWILSSVGRIPAMIVGFMQAMGGSGSGTGALLFTGVIAGVTNTLAPAVSYTAITVQYYNLVEQKEQVSLEQDVGRLGREDEDTDEASPEGAPTASIGAEEEVGSSGVADDSEPPSDLDASDEGSDEDARWQGGSTG